MIKENNKTAALDEKRLEEIAAIIPVVDEESPEITPEQADNARFAHISHPQWFKPSSETEKSST